MSLVALLRRSLTSLLAAAALVPVGAQSTDGLPPAAREVRDETLRTWNAYLEHAWPHDNLLPLSRSWRDWYDEPLGISPIDNYSTLRVMGLDREAERVLRYVVDSSDFAVDKYVKVFEVNIRVLGGLLAMYEWSGDPAVLARAVDFADRLLPAFDSPTGLPYYDVNLATGAVRGDTINVAEAGSYLVEWGLLSYYTADSTYYQAAKRATEAVFARRAPTTGLLGRDLDVTTGEWTVREAMVGAYVDSYFEYLVKAHELFGDEDVRRMWEAHRADIDRHFPDTVDGGRAVWYPRLDMDTGELLGRDVRLWDAYFPGLLVLSGDTATARLAQNAWHGYWERYDGLGIDYDYGADTLINPYFQLNPEVIESNYYLWLATGDSTYYRRAAGYWADFQERARTPVAYAHLADVRTGELDDELATFFIAETLKYFYLTFGGNDAVSPATHVFNTEAHPFARTSFERGEAARRLGFGVE